jgi:hypothetical protein
MRAGRAVSMAGPSEKEYFGPMRANIRSNRAHRRAPRLLLVLSLAGAVAACGGSSDGVTEPSKNEPPPPTPNFIRLESDAGDYIGLGATYNYTQANAVIKLTANGDYLRISVNGDQWWYGDFATPSGAALKPGTYANLTRYPFNSPAAGGLSWYGDGRGCNTLTGSMTIDSVTYAAGTLSAIDLRFTQNCEGGTAALRGTIHWRADDPTGPAGPVVPIPSTLWKPDPAFLPSSGNYVLLSSDPGDWVGGGIFKLYTPPTSPISVTSSGSLISVGVGGFNGQFQSMLGTNPIKAGYYGNLHRFPFGNPMKGALDFSGNGRGCNTLSGWFAVDKIVYSGTTMTALDMRFEQHCEEGATALRGAIHWTA